MPTILLIGMDGILLQTRASVLGRTGCATVCVSAGDALGAQERHRAAVVVLCHTVPEMLRTALSRAIREHWPETRILAVMRYGQSAAEGRSGCVDVVSSNHPEKLLRATSELLKLRPPAPPRVADWTAPAYLH